MSYKNYSLKFDRVLLVVDIVMVFLVVINLLLLGIQLNFESCHIRGLIQEYAEPLYNLYLPVYQNFLFIDAVFVAIFLTELCLRWIIAIYNRTYHRWFFYPFVKWYDVLGCIPLGSFRILRVFRIVYIITRLNRMGVIEIRKTYLYQSFLKYLNIVTEEISDRVVVNVIEGVQKEIKSGIPLTERIIEEVIIPRKDVLVNYVAHRVQKVTKDQYALNSDALRESIRKSVTDAIKQNENIRILEQIPMVGKAASAALQQSVYDITFQAINNVFVSLSSEESRVVIEKITDGIIEGILAKEDDAKLEATFIDMIVHSLDLIKEQVQVQQWKQTETK
jgi:hypothetical protein